MLSNYFRIAWRNLVRQKMFGLINIGGLTVGLSVCILMTVYMLHESSFDRFHRDSNRIFDLRATLRTGDNNIQFPNVSYVTGPLVKQVDPSAESYVRIFKPQHGETVAKPDASNGKFDEDGMIYADSNFFSFFSFQLIKGTPSEALSRPFSLVISEKTAKKYFGKEDALGKILKIKTDSLFYAYQVTGIVKDPPSNSSVQFDMISSNSSLARMPEMNFYLQAQSIQPGDFKTYFLLRHAGDSASMTRTVQPILSNDPEHGKLQLFLIPMPEVHLNSMLEDASTRRNFKIFPFVAFLILLLALVNYMSLTTARATLRAKEVGVRKAAGASRRNIILQFYLESAVFAIPAFLLAFVVAYVCLPLFFGKLGIAMDGSFIFHPTVMIALFFLLAATILAAGSYPSLVLSSFSPIAALKGKLSRKAGGAAVRKFFTVLQFTISVILIICGIVIGRQLYYFRHAETGIDRQDVVMIAINGGFGSQYESFRRDVQSMAGISGVATSRHALYKGYDILNARGKDVNTNLFLPVFTVDNAFIPLLGIRWKVAPMPGVDLRVPDKLVLNESAIAALGLSPQGPVSGLIYNGDTKFEVAGVVRNFNFNSMEYSIRPMAMLVSFDTAAHWGTLGASLFVKMGPKADLPQMIAKIEDLYTKYDKDDPFNFVFLDDAFNDLYKAQDRLSWVFAIFSRITLFLAILGLLGLSSFSIEQRTKEIGIRKVLGASAGHIILVLSGGFLRLVILSLIIAIPVAWWIMQGWLADFAYRIRVEWWMLCLPGLIAIIVTLATVGYHTLRAAMAAPVTSLRSE